jgi:nucleoside-diphosphate-sugar epimerase
VLEWARTLLGLRRLIYLGTGGVYGEPSAASPAGPQPEEGPLDPPELYAVSKLAGASTSAVGTGSCSASTCASSG